MSLDPHFTVAHRIAADLTRIERARRLLEAAMLPEDWTRKMGAHLFTETGGGAAEPKRHYELGAGLIALSCDELWHRAVTFPNQRRLHSSRPGQPANEQGRRDS